MIITGNRKYKKVEIEKGDSKVIAEVFEDKNELHQLGIFPGMGLFALGESMRSGYNPKDYMEFNFEFKTPLKDGDLVKLLDKWNSIEIGQIKETNIEIPVATFSLTDKEEYMEEIRKFDYIEPEKYPGGGNTLDYLITEDKTENICDIFKIDKAFVPYSIPIGTLVSTFLKGKGVGNRVFLNSMKLEFGVRPEIGEVKTTIAYHDIKVGYRIYGICTQKKKMIVEGVGSALKPRERKKR